MKISLEAAGKRYGRHWIFSDCSLAFSGEEKVAVLGANGSGKSTLLRVLSGMQSLSKGRIVYTTDSNEPIAPPAFYQHISYCAPGLELPEEMTLAEFLRFHFTFKKALPGFTVQAIIKETGLAHFAHQQIGDYSSGMRQRVKLAQAIFANTPVLLLDEPCTNLDEAGVSQYQRWIQQYSAGRLVIIASNDAREYAGCNRKISMQEPG